MDGVEDNKEASKKRLHSTGEGFVHKKIKEDTFTKNLVQQTPHVQVHQLETLGACSHEAAVPPGMNYAPLVLDPSKQPAKEYPFILDAFQKEAILCIENNQSVLVSAHTSAGKTVIAEYAVAMSLRRKQRVIYTTPIKALSNQKYRELYEEFKDVGLITGDVTINPSASCLIMTTEILRNMLYRGSEIIREVAWVIYDEIHYMRDKERGVVWEESIILLSDHIHYVFLSATIPNARQFAEWISYIHKQPCHIVSTSYRPVPLHHYIFPAGGFGIHRVVDENGVFNEENFDRAISILRERSDGGRDHQQDHGKEEWSCFKIVNMIKERNLSPIVVFSFSKKECEYYALQFSTLDFNNEEEKGLVELVFRNAVDTLCEEDRSLPQIISILPLLLKGIGIHHSGLLPIIKETIEILFSEGLIKALCATETFAMGLNMPARSVLFTNTTKFDGKVFRSITSGEYIQMSGRAGRRGLDDKGTVIMMVDEKMSPEAGKKIIMGNPDELNSAYHLTYNMILNMCRVEGINPEYVLEKSFFQFQNYSTIPDIEQKLKHAEHRCSSIEIENEMSVTMYHVMKTKIDTNLSQVLSYIQKPQYLLPFLCPGRLVKIVDEDRDFGWGVICNFKKTNKKLKKPQDDSEEGTCGYYADVLLNLKKGSAKSGQLKDIKPCPPEEDGDAVIVPGYLTTMTCISKILVHLPNDLRRQETRAGLMSTVKTIQGRFPDGIPLLDPIEDMGIIDEHFLKVLKEVKELQDKLKSRGFHNNKKMKEIYEKFIGREKLYKEMKDFNLLLRQKKSLLKMDELKKMKRLLRKMKYVDSNDVIQVKGRVACEINSANELVVTEMLLNGVFNDLTPQECCSLLSCFVFQEKTQENPKLTKTLSSAFAQLQQIARQVANESKDLGLVEDVDEYVDTFKPHLMDVVFAWANGSHFCDITKMTNVYEGSIIRCLRRLDELLRQMVQATKTIGNDSLEKNFSEGIQQIKRNIVFSASLYL